MIYKNTLHKAYVFLKFLALRFKGFLYVNRICRRFKEKFYRYVSLSHYKYRADFIKGSFKNLHSN